MGHVQRPIKTTTSNRAGRDGKPLRWMLLLPIALACQAATGQAVQQPSAAAAAVPSAAAFEVASLRRVPANRAGYTEIGPPNTDRFSAKNISLRILLSLAYGLDSRRIESRLEWFDTTLYDVAAKAEGDQPLTTEQLRPLLQRLLEQRFHLGCHRETRAVPGYALLLAKGGPRLPSSKDGEATTAYILHGGLQGTAVSTAVLAGMLEGPAGRPVADRTGLQGTFDIKLSFAAADEADSGLPSFFTAVQEQLGLKLEPQKVPVEVLVLDHADQNPTEN